MEPHRFLPWTKPGATIDQQAGAQTAGVPDIIIFLPRELSDQSIQCLLIYFGHYDK